MTTRIIVVVIVLIVIAVLGFMYVSPTPVAAPVEESNTAPTSQVDTSTGSLTDLENSVNADLIADVSAAQTSADVDASLSSQQEAVTSVTNATNETNF